MEFLLFSYIRLCTVTFGIRECLLSLCLVHTFYQIFWKSDGKGIILVRNERPMRQNYAMVSRIIKDRFETLINFPNSCVNYIEMHLKHIVG